MRILRKKAVQNNWLTIFISTAFHLILILIFMNIMLKEIRIRELKIQTAIITKEADPDRDKGTERSEEFSAPRPEPLPSFKIEALLPPPILAVTARPAEVRLVPYHSERSRASTRKFFVAKVKPQLSSRRMVSRRKKDDRVGFFNALQRIGGVHRKDIVFVIDVSGSMVVVLPDVKKSLLDCLTSLNSGDRFNIILFHSECYYFGESYYSKAKEKLINVNVNNIERAGVFIDSLKTSGGTYILPALKKAFSLAPNIIFLLSDGVTGENEATIRTRVKEINTGYPKVKIEAFYFDTGGADAKQGETLLRRLADENNGHFHSVK